ncbi:MAG TPA: BolA family protein [Paenalcaligenes sp.]|nr:BolA family protein [Paenalcaligenes sp.]
MSTPNLERIAVLKARLTDLEPSHIEVIDESHLHVGHAGAKGGASHFKLIISSQHFEGLSTLARHRLVYDRVHDLMPHPIHALSIQASVNA